MFVLVIVNPGCGTKCQDDLEYAARVLLSPHSYDGRWWLRENHHARGTSDYWGKFERIRGAYDAPGDDLPTLHPLRRADSFRQENACIGCMGTGLVPFAFAINPCPLCGGAGVQWNEEVQPGIFPLWLANPDIGYNAVVTPDGRWRGDFDIHRVLSDYRHCYGVCWVLKS